MDKNSILEFNNKERCFKKKPLFSSLKPYNKIEMSDMCVCFNYQNSIKLFTSIFTSTGLNLYELFFTFYAICPTAIPAMHV